MSIVFESDGTLTVVGDESFRLVVPRDSGQCKCADRRILHYAVAEQCAG